MPLVDFKYIKGLRKGLDGLKDQVASLFGRRERLNQEMVEVIQDMKESKEIEEKKLIVDSSEIKIKLKHDIEGMNSPLVIRRNKSVEEQIRESSPMIEVPGLTELLTMRRKLDGENLKAKVYLGERQKFTLREDVEKAARGNEKWFQAPMERGKSPFPKSAEEREKLEEAVLIKAQNVRDYYVKHYKEHKWNDLRSFTCIKPPFKHMVITYDHAFDAYHDSMGKTVVYEEPRVRHTDLVLMEMTREQFEQIATNTKLDKVSCAVEDKEGDLFKYLDTVRPNSVLMVEISVEGKMIPGRWFIFLDKEGSPLVMDPYGWVYITTWKEDQLIIEKKFEKKDLQQTFAKHGTIALVTIQFMNCRNVQIIDNPPSRQLRRQAERTGTKSPVSYKTLIIHPMGKRRSIPGVSSGIIGEVALHIVRGHFKTYKEEGNGLGKFHLKGTWWWSPQVRGNKEKGRVEKDYDVEAEEHGING